MDSYSEVRRVRKALSEHAGHDIRTLIATINNRWPSEAARALDPGTKAEQCEIHRVANTAIPNGESTQAAR